MKRTCDSGKCLSTTSITPSFVMLRAMSMVFLLLFAAQELFAVQLNQEGIRFLQEYGYLKDNQDSHESQSAETVSQRLKVYQTSNNLPATGIFDKETLDMMDKPRCGVPDNFLSDTESAVKWNKRNLTYMIESFPSNMDHDEARKVIAAAFAAWSAVIPIDFAEKNKSGVDFVVNFYIGDHWGFDNMGIKISHNAFRRRGKRAVAHAFYPVIGDLCFNGNEKWSAVPGRGMGLLQTAMHEVGHSIGLDHLNDTKAIMHAISDNREDPQLTEKEIQIAQSMYGKRATIKVFKGADFRGDWKKVRLQTGVCHDLGPDYWDRVMSIQTNGHCVQFFLNLNCTPGDPSVKIGEEHGFSHNNLANLRFNGSGHRVGNNSRSCRFC